MILPRSTPEAVGLDPAGVQRLVEGFDELATVHAFVLVRDGHVVGEGAWAPHTAERPHMMFSVSKSFTSTAVGLAIEEGLLGLDDRVVDLLADDAPAEVGEQLAAMRVRHLLTMGTGHAEDTMQYVHTAIGRPGVNWTRQILELPVTLEPGSRFVYNTGATYLLAVIVQRLTGARLLDYLRPRLFEPLGIASATWERDAEGLDVGGFGLSITVEELAAFGQLYLQRGEWQGRQLVPAAWVDEATAKQIDNAEPPSTNGVEWEQGYGYQFWRCRYGAYRADGAFGQFAVVWPEHRLVLAVNAGTPDMASILDALWAASLPVPLPESSPASSPESLSASSLPAEAETGAAAQADAAGRPRLRLPTPDGAGSSPREALIEGVPHKLGRNPLGIRTLTLVRDDEGGLTLRLDGNSVPLGYGEWRSGTARIRGVEVASAAAWADESTVVVRMVNLGTPFETQFLLRLTDDHLHVEVDQNVSFGPTHLFDTTATPMSIFEAAGGDEGLRRLAHAWHERVMADPVVSHAFHGGAKPDHTERLAAYWSEALGGPAAYFWRYGDETSVVRLHSGNGVHTEMDERAIDCFDRAMDDVGLTDRRLRRALHDYFAWATSTMARYHESAEDVPSALIIPRWDWNSGGNRTAGGA